MSIVLFSVQRNLDILGLKTLHDMLIEKGHDSRLVYLPRFEDKDAAVLQGLDGFLLEANPVLFGVSVMALDYHYAAALTRHLKQAFPETPVIWGGIHATTAPEMCAGHADFVCIGEGERTMVELAEAAERGAALDGVANLCRIDHGTLKKNPLHPLLDDLDLLPPARQISPASYIQIRDSVTPLEPRHLRAMKRYRGGVYKILTSRGCPYSCTYCANNALRHLYGKWGIRRRGVDHVLTELERARQEKPWIEYIDFSDDCFMASDIEHLASSAANIKGASICLLSSKARPAILRARSSTSWPRPDWPGSILACKAAATASAARSMAAGLRTRNS